MTKKIPLPLFDSIEHMNEINTYYYLDACYCLEDIAISTSFLKAYRGSRGTFNSYRREIERLIHWSALVAGKSLKDINREDIELFFDFCKNPPETWIGISKPPKFNKINGMRTPNPSWRPFVSTVSKAQHRQGKEPNVKDFELGHGSLREVLAILGSFFHYLVDEEYTITNPVALIRQKSKFIRKSQGSQKIRRLTELQWQYVIDTAKELADTNPEQHERTLVIMSSLYSMYLRISELTASERWVPQMNDFAKDSDGNWWFTTVGKGNKERKIAVSDSMLTSLKRWRQYLNLSPLPSISDTTPLLNKEKGRGAITSTNTIRKIVQFCFDAAIHKLIKDNLTEEADTLNEATVHWLRHTGISDDVKTRPREHVRDDAGHGSGAITDLYIDIELRERHLSAKNKVISSKD